MIIYLATDANPYELWKHGYDYGDSTYAALVTSLKDNFASSSCGAVERRAPLNGHWYIWTIRLQRVS